VSALAYDLAAEQSLLGSVLAAPDVAGPALLSVAPGAWWDTTKHAPIAAVLTEMVHRGQGIDPTVVLAQLQTRGARVDGPYLLTLMQRAWVPANADQYAERIMELHARRELACALVDIRQRLDWDWESGAGEFTAAAAVNEMRNAAAVAEVAISVSGRPAPETLAELLEGDITYDWLVPGLLERMERWVLTGSEGTGKSVLIAQFVCCLAAGLHPFTGEPLRSGPVRVLVLDCENPRPASRRRYMWMVKLVTELRDSHMLAPHDWPKHQMNVDLRPGGVDLLGADVSWLEHAVNSTAPDVLAIGPLYKLHRHNPNDEQAARDLVAVLDGIRERYGVAVITEAHAGHAEDAGRNRKMRPSGSSLWLRWPEFGYGLRRAANDPGAEHPEFVDVVAWRGSREERNWPRQLQHGHILPWSPANGDYYDQPMNTLGNSQEAS
jgi:AAA domain-containing protein/DnaB helicase-like protein